MRLIQETPVLDLSGSGLFLEASTWAATLGSPDYLVQSLMLGTTSLAWVQSDSQFDFDHDSFVMELDAGDTYTIAFATDDVEQFQGNLGITVWTEQRDYIGLILNGIGARDLVEGRLVTASFTAMTSGPHLLFTQFGNSGSTAGFGSYSLSLNKTTDVTPWAVRFDPTEDGVQARLASGDTQLNAGDQISLNFDFITGPATIEEVQLAVSGSLSTRIEQIAGRAKVVVFVTLGETALLEDILSFRFSGGQGGGEILLREASVSVRQMFGNFVSAPVDKSDTFTLPSRYTGTDRADTISGSAQADTIWGGAGDDLIYGDDGDDALYGGEGDDTVEGGAGNDSIFAGLGEDITSGGAGIDTLDLTSVTAAVTLNMATGGTNGFGTHTGYEGVRSGSGDDRILGTSGPVTIQGQGGDDAVYGDGYRAAYDLDDARAVYRLYQATLDRVPDAAGQAGWTEFLATDARTLAGVAAGFVGSPEFQSVYGALSNTAFVELLYQNVLGRSADAGGLAGWTNALAGGASRAQVVTGFSESAEFRTSINTAATQFTLGRDPANWQDDVFRLYQATLGRDPDIAGFKGWMTNLGNGMPFLTAVAGFVNSAEFQNTYGALDNTGFVTLLYQNVLNRAPDAGGLTGWLNALADGSTRAEVVRGFSQSGEFIAATALELKTWIRAQGPDDVLEGGAGSNDLWGGAMADVFLFRMEDAGTHRVHDFEAWDYLDFRDFGYADADDARSHMTQQGANLIFADQGTTVTLSNTQLANLDNDTFLF